MAPRRRSRRGRGRRGGSRGTAKLDYEFCYALQSSATPYTWEPTFSAFAIDASRPCRVSRVSLSIASSSGSFAAEVSLFGPPLQTETSAVVIRSRVRAFGTAPSTLAVNLPRNIDYFTPAGNNPVFRVYVAGNVGNLAATISGTVTVEYQRRSVLFTVAKS